MIPADENKSNYTVDRITVHRIIKIFRWHIRVPLWMSDPLKKYKGKTGPVDTRNVAVDVKKGRRYHADIQSRINNAMGKAPGKDAERDPR